MVLRFLKVITKSIKRKRTKRAQNQQGMTTEVKAIKERVPLPMITASASEEIDSNEYI